MRLEHLGWSGHFAACFEEWRARGCEAGRVCAASREFCRLLTEGGERRAVFGHDAATVPVAGDWVAVGDGMIQSILPRRTKVSRKAAGRSTAEQVLAANVDVAFVVMGLDGDFNLRRVERYLVAAWQSGARPVILLNKADLHRNTDGQVVAVEALAPGVPVLALSAATGEGLDQLDGIVHPGETAVLLGSSGTGKSTLVNRLLGAQCQHTASVRESDSRGRHTTSHRELFRLPSGWLLVDTPGLRELQLWAGGEALDRAFSDIEELAQECRFRDCRHQGEPGCAVARAVAEGSLDEARLANFDKLQREVAYTNRRQDQASALAEKRRWKAIHKAQREFYKRS